MDYKGLKEKFCKAERDYFGAPETERDGFPGYNVNVSDDTRSQKSK